MEKFWVRVKNLSSGEILLWEVLKFRLVKIFLKEEGYMMNVTDRNVENIWRMLDTGAVKVTEGNS